MSLLSITGIRTALSHSKKDINLFLRRLKWVLNPNVLKTYCDKAKLSTGLDCLRCNGGAEVDYSQIVFRTAEPRDHEDVKVLCQGALGGRDVLPAKFLSYLKDPQRAVFVADYNGRVVAMVGGRIVDDGNTMEGGSGRALPGLPGLFNSLRAHLVENWMRKHPQVKTFLGVVRNEKTAFGSPNVLAIPVIRDIIDVAWKVPVTAVTKAIDMYKKYRTQAEDQPTVHSIEKVQLSVILDDSNFRKKYFPNGFIVVDSSPFQLNYKGNLDIIADEDNRNLFASYNNGRHVEAISFGTAIEMGSTMDTLRYVIDYYGIPNLASLVAHTMKHICEIPALLEQSQTASDVYIAIFLTENSVNQSILQHFVEFISQGLYLDNRIIKIPSDRQFILKLEK